MASDYEAITLRLREIVNFATDVQVLREVSTLFFSTLLPFHHSYGAAIGMYIRQLSNGELMEDELIDAAFTNKIVTWLYEDKSFVSATKDSLDDSWAFHLPPFSLAGAIDELYENLCLTYHQIETTSNFFENDIVLLRCIALLSCIKEMKMILSKNLFSIFGSIELREPSYLNGFRPH
jgi:hypothetical protein